MGENVRYNGANKYFDFAVNKLANYVYFQRICPEVAIGLGVPRPTIQLVQRDDSVMLRFVEDTGEDLTQKMVLFAEHKIATLHHLCGYIVCAKSPSCGLASVKVYDWQTKALQADNKSGLFTQQLRSAMPWLPIEENSRLEQKECRENFVERLFALHELNSLHESGLSRAKLIRFHSRYKYTLLAHSQPKYRELGLFVANIADWESLEDFFLTYRQQLMDILACPITRENHTNTLMHIQGYFKKRIDAQQKQALTEVIASYQRGETPLSAPMVLLKEYLSLFPDAYLAQQHYFNPYPEALCLSTAN